MMGRKNQRQAVEPAKLPPPIPDDLIVRRVPKPRKPRKADVCRFADCKDLGAFYLSDGFVCERHSNVIWRAVELRDAKSRDQDIPGMEGREYDRAEARKIRSVERRKPTSVGEIYFVRLDGLIKVGWTSKLAERMRSYGPTAVLLANYKATRADEAALHRTLAPARFKGREWYLDNDILQAFVAKALETHGPPRFDQLTWTEPKAIVGSKRASRRWS